MLDKTGTITAGRPEVTDFLLAPSDNDGAAKRGAPVIEDHVLRAIAAVEHASEHPLAEAIVQYALDRGLNLPQVSNFESFPGLGVEGVVEGETILVGNHSDS